jgi:RNase P subunit RPR2
MLTNCEEQCDPTEIKQEVHSCPKCGIPIPNSLDIYSEMETRKNRSGFEYVKVACHCGHEMALVSTKDKLSWPGKNAYLYGRLLYEYSGVEQARQHHAKKNVLFDELAKG